MDRKPAFLALLLLSLTSACTEPSSAPALPGIAAFGLGAQATCPAAPDFVVTTEGDLLAAVAAASPGATIALDGMIGVTADLNVSTPNVTLTCASPGSGLFAQAGGSVLELLMVSASGVAVDRLVLDGSNAQDPYVALNVDGVRLTNNTVICSPASLGGSCSVFSGTPHAVVSGNQFRSAGSTTGLHMQLGIDGTRIENNTVTTTAPSDGPPHFGGLRVRDGANVVISGNTVRGPWANSLALSDLASSSIEHNDLGGAVPFGILARSGTSFRPISMTDDVFRNNQISGAGSAGIFLTSACRNQFVGNDLRGNVGNIAAIFDVSTGANRLLGNRSTVIDNGAFDCDGDGRIDPNIIPTGNVISGPEMGGAVRSLGSGARSSEPDRGRRLL